MAQARTLDVAELIEGRKLGRAQVSVALLLCTLMALEGYDMQTLAMSAPAILREWGVSRAEFGWVLSAHLFGYLIGAMVLTFCGDRLGRKNIILAGVVIFSLFTFMAGFSSSQMEMFGWRFGAGVGLGGAIPTGIALAAEYMPHKIRATTIGFMFVAYNIGSASGGFISAYTIEAFGWPSVFFIGGVAAIPMLLVLALWLPESIRFLVVRGRDHERVAAIARKVRPEEDFSTVSRFVISEESRINTATSLLTEGRATVTILLWAAFILSFTGHYVITAWMPTVLSDDGFTIGEATAALGTFQLGGAIGSFIVAVALDRLGIKVVAWTFLFSVPVTIALGLESTYGLLLVMMLIGGIGVLGGQIGLNALCGTIYPTYMRAMGAGWALGLGRIGAIAGPAIAGYLLAMGLDRPVLLSLAAIPFFFCALSLFALAVAKRSQDQREGVQAAALKASGFAH
jgi:AAHS family 4-hydroxybenzoate transporter-like MFS transporter